MHTSVPSTNLWHTDGFTPLSPLVCTLPWACYVMVLGRFGERITSNKFELFCSENEESGFRRVRVTVSLDLGSLTVLFLCELSWILYNWGVSAWSKLRGLVLKVLKLKITMSAQLKAAGIMSITTKQLFKQLCSSNNTHILM